MISGKPFSAKQTPPKIIIIIEKIKIINLIRMIKLQAIKTLIKEAEEKH